MKAFYLDRYSLATSPHIDYIHRIPLPPDKCTFHFCYSMTGQPEEKEPGPPFNAHLVVGQIISVEDHPEIPANYVLQVQMTPVFTSCLHTRSCDLIVFCQSSSLFLNFLTFANTSFICCLRTIIATLFAPVSVSYFF